LAVQVLAQVLTQVLTMEWPDSGERAARSRVGTGRLEVGPGVAQQGGGVLGELTGGCRNIMFHESNLRPGWSEVHVVTVTGRRRLVTSP